MIDEKDIYRSAKVLIDQHGDSALLEAMHRVERYRAIGNESGMRVWNRIANAIEFFSMAGELTTETIQ